MCFNEQLSLEYFGLRLELFACMSVYGNLHRLFDCMKSDVKKYISIREEDGIQKCINKDFRSHCTDWKKAESVWKEDTIVRPSALLAIIVYKRLLSFSEDNVRIERNSISVDEVKEKTTAQTKQIIFDNLQHSCSVDMYHYKGL